MIVSFGSQRSRTPSRRPPTVKEACLFSERQRHIYGRTLFSGSYRKSSAHHSYSLAHTRDPHPHQPPACIHAFQNLRVNAAAVIADFHSNGLSIRLHANPRHLAARVAVNVRQSLLYHTEQYGFSLARQSSEVFWKVQIHSNSTSLRKAFHVPLQGRRQAHFVQQRWMQ